MIEEAKEAGGQTVLMTFYPHPRMVLFPEVQNLRLLTTQPEKIKLLEQIGIEHLIICPFTLEFSRLKAFDFIRDILVQKIGVYKLLIGYDHQFGRNREGNLKQLEENAQLFGFQIEEIPAQDIDQVRVSSTKIRNALMDGNIAMADEYLGYPYPISGEVIRGNQLGRSIGYPTANIKYNNHYKLIPKDGVYAVEINYNNQIYEGMMNIGRRPTIDNHDAGLTLEVHIFNFDEILYHKVITTMLRKRIRDEIKFDSLNQLKTQLDKDKMEIRAFFQAQKK